MGEQKWELHADLSVPASRSWRTFAADQGTTITALLEVLGWELNEPSQFPDGWEPVRDAWLDAARRTSAERRRR
jgi:hypothetical protein